MLKILPTYLFILHPSSFKLFFLLTSVFWLLTPAYAGTQVTGVYSVGANPAVMATVNGNAEYGLVFAQRNKAVTYNNILYVSNVVNAYLDVNGNLNDGNGHSWIDLIPNANATPADSYYVVTINIQGSVHSEIWIVPDQASVSVLSVRQATAPSSPGTAPPVLFYQTVQQTGTSLTQRSTLNLTGAGVSCLDNSGLARTDCTITGGAGTSPATPTSSGSVKTDALAADPVVYLTSSSDTLLAGKVATTRQVSTSTPLAGGGALSADLTLSCPTCVTQVTSNSPLASSGGTTPAISFANQNANLTLAGPVSGGASAPAFRALVGADLPTPGASSLGGAKTVDCTGTGHVLKLDTTGTFTCSADSGTGGGATFQVNGTNTTGQTLINFQNSVATNGLTLTHSNPSGGNIQLGLSGTLTDAGLAGSYSGVGSCTNQVMTALTRNAAPTCTTLSSSFLPGAVVYNNQANTFSGAGSKQSFIVPTTSAASVNFPSGVAPSTPASGDTWNQSGALKFYDGSATQSILFQSRNISTTSPLAGGGNLGADLALTCSTCVTNVTASSPLSSSGGTTPAISLANQNAHLVLIGPTSGSAAPTFRALAGPDLPNPSATTLGGIESLATASHKWINTISTSGVPSATQPDYSDLTGTPTLYNQTIQANGSAQTQRAAVNLISGSNATVACVDNSGSSRTDCTISASSSAGAALSQITSAAGANSINNGDNAQTWNWSLTTASKSGFTFGENVASTATGTPILFSVNTLTSSTAYPFQATARGTANGIRVDAATGTLSALGTANINATQYKGGSASGTGSCTNQAVTALNDAAAPTCTTITSAYTSGTFSPSAHNLLSATHGDTVAASPVLGDLLYGNSSPAWTKLAGNTTSTKKYLAQTGNGTVSAVPAWTQPACGDLSNAAASCSTDATNASNIGSGTLPAGRLPNPSATTLGGIESLASASHKWINTISTSGVASATQPDYSDLTGVPTLPATLANASHKWLNSYTSSTGLFTQTQPDYSDLTGVPSTFTPTAHNLLSTAHGDTTAGTVARGDVITGQGASPTWTRLAKGTASQCLQMDGSAVDVIWGSCATGGSGISTLNTLTASTQTFATGTTGTDFNISSATSTHTFNIPDAGASARGLVTTGSQIFGGAKTFSEVDLNGSGDFALTATGTNADVVLTPNGTGKAEVTDGTTPSKVLKFDISGNTSAVAGTLATAFTTAKTWTIPDATDTAVGKATTDTLTNKTLDAEGTGNSVTIPAKVWFVAAGCNNATAVAGYDLPTTNAATPTCQGTNVRTASLDYADSAVQKAYFNFQLPADWTGNIDAKIKWFTTATTNATKWQIATGCLTDGTTDATAGPTLNTVQTVTDNDAGTAKSPVSSSIATLTTTGCAAGRLMYFELSRDNTDTNTATASVLGVELTIRRAL